MTKTAQRQRVRSIAKPTPELPTVGRGSADPLRIDAKIVRQICNLADIIVKLECAGGELPGNEEDHDEGEKIKNKAIGDLYRQLETIEEAVYAAPVRPDDKASLSARAALLKFRIGEEWGDYRELHFGVERAAGKLLEGVLSFCRTD